MHKAFKCFHIKQDREPQKWHAMNLIPSGNKYADVHEDYANRMICWEVSDGRSEEYQRLYADVAASEVYEMYGMKLANEWH